MKGYVLEPTNGRESFGYKAFVEQKGRTRTLLSYYKPIVRINADGSFTRLCKLDFRYIGINGKEKKGLGYGTCCHIKAFTEMTKEQFSQLPYRKPAMFENGKVYPMKEWKKRQA